MSYISSISNYDWWQYIRCDGTKSKSGVHTRLTDHLLYHLSCEQNSEVFKLKYIPGSPRNRLMYYCYTDEPRALKSSIAQLLKHDSHDESINDDNLDNVHQQTSKHRRYTTHILKVSPEKNCDNMGVPFNTIKNSTDKNRNLYSTFSQQLITDGIIQWCKQTEDEDVDIMSNYSHSTGNLLPLSYVHVTSITSDRSSGETLLKCTYYIYNTIQCAGLSGIDLSQVEDVVLDESMTCMHCRFYRQYLSNYRHNLHSITSSSIIDRKVKSSLTHLNNPVNLIGIAAQHSTTKVSVVHDDMIAMLHINFNQSNCCNVKCQNGECNGKTSKQKEDSKKYTN